LVDGSFPDQAAKRQPQPVAAGTRLKIVVLDDDPTGSQTLHGCPLLLRWDPPALAAGLRQASPFLFLLANTRALAPDEAAARVRHICRALAPALASARAEGVIDDALLVSRGDSTLRGHFPLEVEALAEELGPIDATFLVPAFLEGGRTTVDGVHRLQGQPVHETPFARDGLFAYHTSELRHWVEEKTGGRLPADQVGLVSWRELEDAAAHDSARRALRQRLAAFRGNRLVVVDAERPEHLEVFGALARELGAPPWAVPWGDWWWWDPTCRWPMPSWSGSWPRSAARAWRCRWPGCIGCWRGPCLIGCSPPWRATGSPGLDPPWREDARRCSTPAGGSCVVATRRSGGP